MSDDILTSMYVSMSDDLDKRVYEASRNGDAGIVKDLLEAGADPNNYRDDYGSNALHRAAVSGHNDVINTLIEAGAEVNVKDNIGRTALYRAVVNDHRDVVIPLLEAGADPELGDDQGRTPIEMAKQNTVIAGLEINKKYLFLIKILLRAMRHFDPTRALQKEYNKNVPYKYLISVALSQGYHDVVINFLENVSTLEKKGRRLKGLFSLIFLNSS